MQNGGWIACTYLRKESIRIRDLFVGHGSDGRWHYSTFHFCLGKVILRTESQSESLDTFAKTNVLPHLSGHSDQSH